MASWIQSLFGDQRPKELAKLLAKAERDRKALRDLLKRADQASKSLVSLAEPLESVRATVDSVSGQVAELEGRFESVEAAASRVDVVEKRSEELEASQRERSSSLEETAKAIDDLHAKVLDVRAVMDGAMVAKNELAELSGPKGSMARLLGGVDRLNADFEKMEARGDSLEKGLEQITGLETRSAELAASQDRLNESLEQTHGASASMEERVGGLRDQVSSLEADLQQVAVARQEVQDFLAPQGALTNIRKQVEQAREQALDYAENVARIREDQAELRSSHDNAAARYEELSSGMDALGESTKKAIRDIAKVEGTMQDLEKADELSARTERQLLALKTLADHMNQKVASLERHREAMDRTEAQARGLTNLHWELESRLKDTRAQIKEVKKVNASIEELRTISTQVKERASELRTEQAVIHKENKLLQATMGGLQEEMRRGTKRFALEQGGLEAISQRILALRAGLTEFEHRFRALDDTSKVVREAERKVDDVAARASTISADLARLSEQVELVEAMREGMAQALATASDVEGRFQSIEARRAEVREAVDDLATLRASGEEVANTLERLRATRAEIDRMQTAQSETGAWLATTHESTRDLQQKVAELDDLAGNIHHMRQNADNVMASASDLEARKESFEELETRMSELRQVGSQLDERTSNLLSTLADAEHRLKTVTRRADKADEVRVVIEAVSAKVQKAERHMEELGGGVESVVERQEALTILSQRVDRLMADIEQGRQALAQATEHFDRVAELRKEAAAAVQTLEDQIRTASEDLRNAEEQSDKVGARAERLEARAGSLRFAEKRITQFEEKLAQLDKVERELDRSVETLINRQDSLDQLRDDVQALFATSESTLEDVRAISAARDEVQGASETLDAVRAKADTMTKVLDKIDGRQLQIQQAEERLSRADALLMEIRVGLESLASQKAVIDHVIATSGKLTFETKEAEGLIEALREERELTQGVHDAVKKLRETGTDIRAL